MTGFWNYKKRKEEKSRARAKPKVTYKTTKKPSDKPVQPRSKAISTKAKAKGTIKKPITLPRATPLLNAKESKKFLKKVEDDLKYPVGPVPTPKLPKVMPKKPVPDKLPISQTPDNPQKRKYTKVADNYYIEQAVIKFEARDINTAIDKAVIKLREAMPNIQQHVEKGDHAKLMEFKKQGSQYQIMYELVFQR